MKHFGELESTIGPARYRFASIVLIYLTDELPVPEAVMEAFVKFERIAEWASYELRIGLWA